MARRRSGSGTDRPLARSIQTIFAAPSAMRLPAGDAMLLLDEICYNRLCRPIMRSYSYYTNFFDFAILRKML